MVDKGVVLPMPFAEALERLARVPKKAIEGKNPTAKKRQKPPKLKG
jgi:hypothetical protein